ncbi:5-carboxymethyl-2-hydroxymuconate semialdehyde dehydrogenase [Klebsiella pneumoniae]|nr:5-carboxymethyl-2-hydroxymuconate semialdehyde dehydrogenase [Klebsiella pneumoniae]
MKKINHWINGKNVAGADYFHTTNPATGEVLAEVASGGEAEINQAVAAAKEAFPKWANLPMKERARLMRRLGDLIDQNVPEIAAMETADTGLADPPDQKRVDPARLTQFRIFAEVCQQMNGKTYPVDDKMLNYTLVQPVGVCALVSPWNVPFMTATWKVAPCLALGNTAVLKMSETVAADRRSSGRAGAGSRDPGWRTQCGAGLRRHRRRRAGAPS